MVQLSCALCIEKGHFFVNGQRVKKHYRGDFTCQISKVLLVDE